MLFPRELNLIRVTISKDKGNILTQGQYILFIIYDWSKLYIQVCIMEQFFPTYTPLYMG